MKDLFNNPYLSYIVDYLYRLDWLMFIRKTILVTLCVIMSVVTHDLIAEGSPALDCIIGIVITTGTLEVTYFFLYTLPDLIRRYEENLTVLLETIRELEELKAKFYRKSRVDLDEPEYRDEQ